MLAGNQEHGVPVIRIAAAMALAANRWTSQTP
jgi:hypothetical protein